MGILEVGTSEDDVLVGRPRHGEPLEGSTEDPGCNRNELSLGLPSTPSGQSCTKYPRNGFQKQRDLRSKVKNCGQLRRISGT